MTLDLSTVGKGLQRKEPVEIAEGELYAKDKFLIPSHYKQDIESILIPRGLLLDRIEKLAVDIRNTYGEQPVHLICILKGSRGFFSDLCKILNRIHKYSGGHPEPPYVSTMNFYMNFVLGGALRPSEELP